MQLLQKRVSLTMRYLRFLLRLVIKSNSKKPYRVSVGNKKKQV